MHPSNQKKLSLSKESNFLKTFNPRQYWSLPYFVICYITKNPLSAKGYQKLIQCCKHFFIKNSIIVCEKLYRVGEGLWGPPWWAYLNKKEIRIKAENLPNQFWITKKFGKDYFTLNGRSPFNKISYIFPKIYQTDVKDILFKHQKILLNDFLLFSSKHEKFLFWFSTIENEDGSIVPIEDIVAILPKIKSFEFLDALEDENDPAVPSFTKNTVKKLLKFPHFSKIDKFELHFIPELFDIETFYTYLKKNKHTKLLLQCATSVSAAYRNRMKEIVAEIAADENRDYIVPDIY